MANPKTTIKDKQITVFFGLILLKLEADIRENTIFEEILRISIILLIYNFLNVN